MALFSRPGARSSATGTPVAQYARILDGEHLWLAVHGTGPLTLRAAGGGDVEVPTEERDGLLTAVFALGEATADLDQGATLTLMAGVGRRAVAVRHEATAGDPAVTHDGHSCVRVEAVDGVVVVRRHRARGVEASAFVSVEGGVGFRLAASESSVSLVVKDQVVAELLVDDGYVALGALPALAAGTTATLRIGDRFVVRRNNVLTRPHYSVLLPPMVEPDVELRWLKDGRLAVYRSAP